MTLSIRDVMTPNPEVLPAATTLEDAARCMRERNIGDVLVADESGLCGLVTDRDIVVRGLAKGKSSATLGDICSRDLVTASPDEPVDDAITVMSWHAIRRLPVMEDGRAVGMVSIGDLAVECDRNSALADISAAPANH